MTRSRDTIKLALRLFGGLLIFMGGIMLAVGLIDDDVDALAPVIIGVVMLALGIGLLFLPKKLARAFGETVASPHGNPETGAGNRVTSARTFQAGNSTIQHTVVHERPAGADGELPEFENVRKTWRMDERDRFICGRGRSAVLFCIGLGFWIAFFFYSDGWQALFADGSWSFDMFSAGMILAGLIFVAAGGLKQELVIDKAVGRVLRDWSWLFVHFPKTFPLSRFDHVAVRYKVHQSNHRDSSGMQRTETRYEVLLSGNEDLYITGFENPFHALALARRVAEYTGFPVKEEL
ncbi:MAG: hypothetical protein KIT18_01160 [Burkholderiales bacterium]|nr:hypothetical protein [Burkholderiales bacterium]